MRKGKRDDGCKVVLYSLISWSCPIYCTNILWIKEKKMKALEILYHLKYRAGTSNRKEVEEAIIELEALQSRSCEVCKYWDFEAQGHFKKCFNGRGNTTSTEASFCCNRYEAKEQL